MSCARSEVKSEAKTEMKDEHQARYEEKRAAHLKNTEGLSSLYKHIYYCLDSEGKFSAKSIAQKIKDMHGATPDLIGYFIDKFNSIHSGTHSCPAFFDNGKTKALAKFLHLGTTRIWNADGSFNEDRWNKLMAAVTQRQEEQKEVIVVRSELKEYLAYCLLKDAPDFETGRQAEVWNSSKKIQAIAAVAAWDEVFDRLACGWVPLKEGKPGELEPYLTKEVTREFFEDSALAFLRAECGLLPVPKPVVTLSAAPKA